MVSGSVTRYLDALQMVTSHSLYAASLGEYATLRGPYRHRGVEITLLDLSSKNPTGTFEDWVACLTIAYCLEHHVSEFVAHASGNAANALARYAEPHGITAHIFYPSRSAEKILPQVIERCGSNLYERNLPEAQLAAEAALFATKRRLPILPSVQLQMEAHKLSAYLLHDPMFCAAGRFDYHVRAISSGYGTLGFYLGCDELIARGANVAIPRLLGVQLVTSQIEAKSAVSTEIART